MVANEGVRRLKLLGRLLFLGGFGSAMILGGAFLLGLRVIRPVPLLPPMLLPFTFPLMLLGGVLWVGGWVLEGFLAASEF
jgi:hypothetical protein